MFEYINDQCVELLILGICIAFSNKNRATTYVAPTV